MWCELINIIDATKTARRTDSSAKREREEEQV